MLHENDLFVFSIIELYPLDVKRLETPKNYMNTIIDDLYQQFALLLFHKGAIYLTRQSSIGLKRY